MVNENEASNTPLTETLSVLIPFSDRTLTSTSSSTGSYAAHNQNQEFSSIDKEMLTDLMKTKDSDLLRRNFNGVGGLAKALQTNLEHGINGQDTERRLRLFDSNTYNQQPPKRLVYFLVEAFKHPIKLIQLLVSVVSLGFNIKVMGAIVGWSDGSNIFLAFLVIVLSAVTNFIRKRQFQYHSSKISNNIQIDVLRDKGRRQKISIFDVVVGDVVVLNIGDQIPADGLFIDGHSLVVDESSNSTGSESDDHIEIDAIRHPFLISGSKVVDGLARMLVLSVGMNTNWGKMMSSKTVDSSSDEQTPLQSFINILTNLIGMFVCLFALLQLLIIVIRYFTKVENGNQQIGSTVDVILLMLFEMSAMVEVLSLFLTVELVIFIKRMMDDLGMVVRKLLATEAMSSIDFICTQITGISTNQMEVTKHWLGLDHIEEDDGSICHLPHVHVCSK